jgi:hypothetical protein
MGSFDVSCGLSNLSIREGDRTGLVLLLPTNRNKDLEDSSSLVVNVDDRFRPFLTPIYGTYNDYGSLENLERNASVEILEDIFSIPIETIVYVVNTSGRSIYSNYIGDLASALGSTLTPETFGFGVSQDESLTRLGLTVITSNVEYSFGGYNLVFSKGLSATITKDGETLHSFHSHSLENVVEMFGDRINNYPGFPNCGEKIRLLKSLSGMFFYAPIFDELKQFPEDEWTAQGTQRVNEEVEKYFVFRKVAAAASQGEDDRVFFTNSFLVPDVIRRMFHFNSDADLLLKYEGTQEIQELSKLMTLMTQTNHALSPTMYAGQEGDSAVSVALHKAALKVITDRQTAYDDYED